MDRTPEDLTRGIVEGERHRPRDLAVLLLAIGADPPRVRARDQQADRAGADLRRRVLDRLAALDPDPDPEALGQALAAIVAEFGEPTGPTRGVCSQWRQEWEQTLASPGAWAWFLAEALERTKAGDEPGPKRGRSRGAP